MSKKVVIVGTGPAGLFAALELSEHSDAEIRMYEKGPDLCKRTKDDLTSGLGGSGAFSDGKLTMPDPRYPKSLNVGGQLPGLIGEERYLELVE
ncbi:MAG: NAD(P)-binding protein, partial [Candidatus Paceibacterota bacterium]